MKELSFKLSSREDKIEFVSFIDIYLCSENRNDFLKFWLLGSKQNKISFGSQPQTKFICKINVILKKILGGKKVLGPLSKDVVILIIREKEFLIGLFHLFWP